MAKQLIGVSGDLLYMFADKCASEAKPTDRCVVYNTFYKQFVPNICIGSWTARVFDWQEPTAEQIQKGNELLKQYNENMPDE